MAAEPHRQLMLTNNMQQQSYQQQQQQRQALTAARTAGGNRGTNNHHHYLEEIVRTNALLRRQASILPQLQLQTNFGTVPVVIVPQAMLLPTATASHQQAAPSLQHNDRSLSACLLNQQQQQQHDVLAAATNVNVIYNNATLTSTNTGSTNSSCQASSSTKINNKKTSSRTIQPEEIIEVIDDDDDNNKEGGECIPEVAPSGAGAAPESPRSSSLSNEVSSPQLTLSQQQPGVTFSSSASMVTTTTTTKSTTKTTKTFPRIRKSRRKKIRSMQAKSVQESEASSDAIYRALKDCLEPEDAKVYLDALQNASAELRSEECNQDWFWPRLSAKEAAQRLVRYWIVREETLSAEYQYRSLDQTGEGALQSREIRLLNLGYAMILPVEPAEGGKGLRNVLSIDASNLHIQNFPPEAFHRVLFYMLTLLTQEIFHCRDGKGKVVILHRGPVMKTVMDFLIEELLEIFPIELEAMHIITSHALCCAADTKILATKLGKKCPSHVHIGTTKKALSKSMKPFGFVTLPKYCGGDWGLEKFFHWQELRVRMEWKVPLGLSGRGSATGFPAIRDYAVDFSMVPSERKRRLNAIHSRRKRSRIRVSEEILLDNVEDLTDEKAELMEERTRLEGLLVRAQTLVRSL